MLIYKSFLLISRLKSGGRVASAFAGEQRSNLHGILLYVIQLWPRCGRSRALPCAEWPKFVYIRGQKAALDFAPLRLH
jgi:hypothetical protein